MRRKKLHRRRSAALIRTEQMEPRILLTTIPVVDTLTLVNDTGSSSTDNVTADATVTGTVSDDDTVAVLNMELDIDNDGSADIFLTTDSSGNFTYDLTAEFSSYGSKTVKARAEDANDGWSNWKALTFTFENNAPEMDSFELDNDTGPSSTDKITTDATIAGTVSNDTSVDGLLVEIDTDGDGNYDYTTTTDSNSDYSYSLNGSLAMGSHTVKVRVEEIDPITYESLFSDWDSLTFTLEADVYTVYLINDTGTPGDNKTTDATIGGYVLEGDVDNVTIEIDTDGDGVADVTTTTDESGYYEIDLGSYLNFEVVTIYVRTPNGEWLPLTFEYLSS